MLVDDRSSSEVLGDLAYVLDLLHQTGRVFGGASQLLIRPLGDGDECTGFELDLQLVRSSEDGNKDVAILSGLVGDPGLRALVLRLVEGTERLAALIAAEVPPPEERSAGAGV